MIGDYHFGGYAKVNGDLIDFVNEFYLKTQIPLDLIYTGKMMFGLFEMINEGFFLSNAKILFIHSGGVQGNEGFKSRGIKLIF
jgi:1-aminocyclopropane-1-carboxylate deaminase